MSVSTAEVFIHALFTNKLDQCNSLLVNCSQTNIAKLQVLQNSALQLVFRLPHAHIPQQLKEQH